MAALHPLRTMRTISICIDRSVRPSSSFLLPFLQQQQRAASILSSLSDNPGAYKKKIRRGRGPSSGKGKTSGRGHKGQKQHGKVPAGFNGGQTPDHVVRGETGFYQHFRVDMSPLNLDRLQDWIDQGRIDPTKPITMKELNDSRCLHGVKDGVKLLARGSEKFKTPIQIVASRASATAIAAIEAAGGTVTTRFYTKSSIRRILRGQSTNDYEAHLSTTTGTVDPSRPFSQYRLPDPTGRKDIEYYRDPAHRGYLSHTVEKGEGPSLFFKTPHQKKHHKKPDATIARAEAPQTKEDKEANRIW